MAGRISLGVLVAFLLAGLGYAAGRFEKHDAMLCFKVARVAGEGQTDVSALSGLKAPFTVLTHEVRLNVTLPGELGRPGDEIYLPDPRGRQTSDHIGFRE